MEPLSHLGKQGVVLPGGLPVGLRKGPGHRLIVPALGGQLGAALLIGPGGIENAALLRRHGSGSQSRSTLAKKLPGEVQGPMAHLLEHNIVPVFPGEGGLGAGA